MDTYKYYGYVVLHGIEHHVGATSHSIYMVKPHVNIISLSVYMGWSSMQTRVDIAFTWD